MRFAPKLSVPHVKYSFFDVFAVVDGLGRESHGHDAPGLEVPALAVFAVEGDGLGAGVEPGAVGQVFDDREVAVFEVDYRRRFLQVARGIDGHAQYRVVAGMALGTEVDLATTGVEYQDRVIEIEFASHDFLLLVEVERPMKMKISYIFNL